MSVQDRWSPGVPDRSMSAKVVLLEPFFQWISTSPSGKTLVVNAVGAVGVTEP